MEETNRKREMTLIERMSVEFEEKAFSVIEEAYEMLCVMAEKFLANLNTERSFAEIYALRMQVRMLVEEIVLREVVNVFH